MNFTKIQVNGNDYIYVKCFEGQISNPEDVSREVSHRRYGIGSDGLVMILPSSVADCKMEIYNSDGSPAEICGNALMSVGLYLYRSNIDNITSFTIETSVGIKTVNIIESTDDIWVEANLGIPNFKAKEIPILTTQEEFTNTMISLNGQTYISTGVSMGNPHLVICIHDLASIDVKKLGSEIQNLRIFPEGINVEFIQIEKHNLIKMGVYERGSGETWSCGSGACASVAVAVRNGYCDYDEAIKVIVKGGELVVRCSTGEGMIVRAQPKVIFDGEYILS